VISKTKPKTKTFIKRVSEGDLKNNLLEYNPEFLFYLEEAREEYLKLGGLSTNEYLERGKT
jgi:acyl-CoA thioesterase FadM